ncbi:MAG TPA: N-acyl homoserine lactonase family protein [Acidiferrobacteraceae bacterium]|nr:N-acyl homoserine lactonase family protein [Acidiferrobacteraceae bacterium]HEX20649.1 N-acyl homoserine lactonase family protein [Acidiferrobacteraceae bacterium]
MENKKMPRTLTLFLLLTTVLALSACDSKVAKEPVTKLYVFECGILEFQDISGFSPGVDKGVAKTLTNSCYLVQHKKGYLLWDTGLSDSLGAKGIELKEWKIRMSMRKSLMQQLKKINVKPEDITYLGISHFHYDHTGNANNFPNAALLVQKEEYETAFGKEPEKYFFDPRTYDKINKDKAVQLTGDHDVFGDGRVIIKRAIGHTPGHQYLYVHLEQTGGIVISGDIVHYSKNWKHKRVPSFNFNKKQSIKAMADAEAFIKEKKARFWIQHDLEQNANIKHAPEFYQ